MWAAASIAIRPPGQARHHLAAAAVLVVLAHAVLLGMLARPQAGASPERQGTHAQAPRISWLKLVAPAPAAEVSHAGVTGRLPAGLSRSHRATPLESFAPLTPPTLLVPLAPLAQEPLVAMAASRLLAAHPFPSAPEVPVPAPATPAVTGVPLPSQIGAHGLGSSLGRRGARGLEGAPPRTAGSLHAWPPTSGDASAAAQGQLVAALLRQVDALGGAPSADTGRCRAAEAQRLQCDHAEADAALGEAGAAIATLLHTLAAIDNRLRQPALVYADGRFRVELR